TVDGLVTLANWMKKINQFLIQWFLMMSSLVIYLCMLVNGLCNEHGPAGLVGTIGKQIELYYKL
ncbi:MAG TPA: hypothetical protein VKI61_10920, partial [Chitinophagaceae bacterium]|nr:hypothetical protein [Chitinophagaceae bacterium]